MTFPSLFCADALDPYAAIHGALPREQLPRVLNADDLDTGSPWPRPVIIPEGDFNHDGRPDIAISGIYDLPSGPNRYFLLVATPKEMGRFEKLYFREYKTPVFLHPPATTGPGDPGDQAFSLTFCADCNVGVDVYWEGSRVVERPWKKKTARQVVPVAVPAVEPAAVDVDAALKIVGVLPDVQAWVSESKKQGIEIATRVAPAADGKKNQFNVTLLERGKNTEKIYDLIEVNVKSGKIIGRQKKEAASDTSR